MTSKIVVTVDGGEARRSKETSKVTVNTNSKLDSSDEYIINNNGTPRTEASTPSPRSVQTDSWSPGLRKSKVASSKEVPLPDFITQTDKYGHAVTPRSATAIQQARVEHPSGAKPHLHVKEGKLTEEQDSVDVCTETLLDSIRIMCCCRLPEEPTEKSKSAVKDAESGSPNSVDERPRLLPKLHKDDHGKKCLVLDLDETLVHSSFRAVPGADFVIPVQVRACVCTSPPNDEMFAHSLFSAD
jgi:TFIIF-interacting CTD phosphatase-like protein